VFSSFIEIDVFLAACILLFAFCALLTRLKSARSQKQIARSKHPEASNYTVIFLTMYRRKTAHQRILCIGT